MNPEKIGKYTVIELLGRGGMGEVYLGEDPYIGRRVAIKIIKGADPAARDRFLHEARVIGGLAHPAIVSLLDFDFSGDEPFLVMEYLKGESLETWIHNPHSLPEQLVVLDDLCRALAFAHENGVLHRDVKPSNVQILPNGHAKLMDFGIARAEAGRLTATGAVVGTPEYMAPEILNDAAYSTRSDLYACGVLLYQMFTGANPFSAKSIAASLNNVMTLNPPDLRSVHPGFPPLLSDALMACLRKEPARRPGSFDALIAAGREAGGGGFPAPVPTPPAGLPAAPPPASLPETRAIPRVPTPIPLESTRALPQTAPRARATSTRWWGAAGATGLAGFLWLLNRGQVPPIPAPVAAPAVSASPLGKEAAPSPLRQTALSPSPKAVRPPAVTPTPVRTMRGEQNGATESPARSEPMAMPALTPSATPVPSVAPPMSSPTPQGRVPSAPEPLPPVTPSPSAPSQPLSIAPRLFPASARTVRRGDNAVVELKGEGLRKDLTAVVLQGRRPAAGIRVVRQEFVGPGLIRVTILIETETPLLSYSLVLRDATGSVTPGLQIEVVL